MWILTLLTKFIAQGSCSEPELWSQMESDGAGLSIGSASWALAQLRGTYLDEKMRGIESCCHSAHWAGPPAGLWQGEEPFSYLPRGTMDWPQPDPPPFHSHASQRPIGAKNHKGQEQRTSKRKHRPIP